MSDDATEAKGTSGCGLEVLCAHKHHSRDPLAERTPGCQVYEAERELTVLDFLSEFGGDNFSAVRYIYHSSRPNQLLWSAAQTRARLRAGSSTLSHGCPSPAESDSVACPDTPTQSACATTANSPGDALSPSPDGAPCAELPDNIWALIMNLVGVREVCMLARCDTHLRRIASSLPVWQRHYEKLFGTPPELPVSRTESEHAAILRRTCRRSALRAARWLDAVPTETELGGASCCLAVDATKAVCGERECVRVYAHGCGGGATGGDGGEEPRKLGTLRGHAATVCCVALTDEALLSGDVEGSLRLWDAEDFKLRRAFKGHAGSVTSCILLPGVVPISGGSDGTVRIWNPHAGAPLARLECDTDVAAMAVDGSSTSMCPPHLYVGGGFIDCFDIASASRLIQLFGILDEGPGCEPVCSLSTYGPLLAAGSVSGNVSLWDVRAGPRVTGCLPIGKGLACRGLQLGEWQLATACSGSTDVEIFDIRAYVSQGYTSLSGGGALAPVLTLPVDGPVGAIGFCGQTLVAAVEGKATMAFSFDDPCVVAAASPNADVAADDSASKGGDPSRRKKTGYRKVRGRYPKKQSR